LRDGLRDGLARREAPKAGVWRIRSNPDNAPGSGPFAGKEAG
jgi:hypothetical protein